MNLEMLKLVVLSASVPLAGQWKLLSAPALAGGSVGQHVILRARRLRVRETTGWC